VEWGGFEQLFKAVCGLDALVGMRLHSLILGSMYNLPMVGIVYDPKVESFCRYMGIPCIRIEDLSAQKIVSAVDEVLGNTSDYTDKVKLLKRRYMESWDVLKELIPE
jgi:polysaccharide pyruvyl transferase WcaK-like protein